MTGQGAGPSGGLLRPCAVPEECTAPNHRHMRAELHITKSDLPEPLRRASVAMLNQLLADALDLEFQARQARWNVKGPAFLVLRCLFGAVSDQLGAFADALGERIAALGGITQGTVHAVARSSRLPRYPDELATGRGHLEALSGNMACFARSARDAGSGPRDLVDDSSADLLREVVGRADRLLWLLEAHLQARE